jgi:O-antigen/teichoic acid export membrane protein
MGRIYPLLSKIFTDPRFKFTIVRYGATAAIAIELLLFARLLGPQSFGNYALSVQIVGLLLLVGAGSGAGYVYVYFKNPDPDLEYIYLAGSICQYLGGALFLVICALFSGSYLLVSSLLLLLQIPYLITEPMLRVRNQFTLPAIGRASGSMATIPVAILASLWISRQSAELPRLDLNTGIALMTIGNCCGYSIYYYRVWKSNHIQIDMRKLWHIAKQAKSWLRYWQDIIAPYWLYIVSSILFVAFTYVDRLFLEAYYPNSNLSIYSLAWQIAQSVLLLLNSLNIISGVRIGESQDRDPKILANVIDKQIKLSLVAGIGTFMVAILASILMNATIYKDYTGLTIVTIVLALGYLTYGVVGSVTMSLFFDKRFVFLIVVNLMILSISCIGNIMAVSYHWSFLYPISISSGGLVLGYLAIWYRIRTLNHQKIFRA